MVEHLCVREDYDAALHRFMRAVQGLRERTLPFSDLYMTREITSKAQAAGNNITAHVKRDLEAATGQLVLDGARLVYVATCRDAKAASANFSHFSLAAAQPSSFINTRWYVDELVNACEMTFCSVFGKGFLGRLARNQNTLGNALGLAEPSRAARDTHKVEAKVKTKNSKALKKEQKRKQGQMAEALGTFLKKAKTS
jgi:hypothetical protein